MRHKDHMVSCSCVRDVLCMSRDEWNTRPIEDALRARLAWRTDDPPKDRPFLADRYPDPWVVRWDEEESGFFSVPGGYQCAVTKWMDIPEVPCQS